ncbi:MAG: hypothetical protein E7564_06775 [Ruminococcaceae bacterium]|nr:hypothetical protein [Oscillospiraceae bacterium]
MKTRILAMLLALAMIVTVFAACGGETAGTSTSTSTSVSESKPADDKPADDKPADDQPADDFPWTKYDDVQLYMVRAWNGNADADDTWYDNDLAAYIREKIGVTVKNDGCMMKETEKLNLMFASGDMPDIVSCANWGGTGGETGIIKKGANEGTITEISAYITGDKKDMFQYIQLPFEIGRISIKYYESDIDFNGDGTLYWLPQELTGEKDQQHWAYGVFVRGDVPEALGFKPEEIRTTDQLVEVLYKAKEYGFKDWNGNDCIVASTRHAGWSYGDFLVSYDRFALTSYIVEEDGSVTTDLLSQRWIDKNMVMFNLVHDGIFDVECFTHTDDRADQLMGNGTILFWGAQYGAGPSAMDTSGLLDEKPEWMYEAIGPLNYVDGKQSVQIESEGRTGSPVIFFPSTTQNLEAALTYYDYLNSPEGQAIYSYGIPGVTFEYNEEGLPRAKAEYFPDADDTDEEKAAKSDARKALGVGGNNNNLSRTQLINQQKTWFKEDRVGANLGASRTEYDLYQEDYVTNRRPIEIIPGYAASGLVTGFERYQEVSEILDDTVQTDYVQRAFFAQSEEEALQILNDYITKVTTEKDGLYLEFLDWIAENVVGSRDDLAW